MTRPMDEIRNLEYLSIDMSMWVIQFCLVFKMATAVTCSSDFYADLPVEEPDDPKTLGYELFSTWQQTSNILTNTIGRFPEVNILAVPILRPGVETPGQRHGAS